MFRATQIAATGMSAQQLNVEIISNNIANLNTTGFKRSISEFQDLLYQNLNRDVGVQSTTGGNLPPTGMLVGLGVKPGGIYRNIEQGTLVQTRNNFDLAIQGKGYFQVTDSNGVIYYTRAGRFSPNNQGVIVDAQGFTVDPTITIPENASEVTINQQGEVFVTTDDSPTPQNLGQITLINFINEGGLRPVGNNSFKESQASGTPITGTPGAVGFGTIEQGFVENSNVDAVYEITTLIAAQRAYELNSKVIQTSDEMMGALNQVR